MQGIYIDGRRPKSKREIRDIVALDPERITVEANSMFGGEYQGPLGKLPEGQSVTFVGPDPHTKRNFYGTLTHSKGTGTIKVQ